VASLEPTITAEIVAILLLELQMLTKRILRSLIALTPYEIRRRAPDGEAEHYDVIQHNSEMGMDQLFANPAFLAKYNSPARRRLHQQTLDWITAQVEPEKARVVGDFGCGPADFFALMATRYPRALYFGYDFSEAVLRAARHGFPAGSYEKHDIYEPPPRQHEVTICSQTLEHLLEPEVALRRLIAATKPGGLLVLTVPNGRTDTYLGHINFWSAESWKAWIARNAPNVAHEFRIFERGTSGGSNLAAALRPN
jgi:2-polyprenyl-3-methyl-5-hydroxy-6-metoxy-1,4-benzoquinol methylase